MARIFITGDTHGDVDWGKLNTRLFPEQKTLTKDDYLIVAGDFGVVWGQDKTEEYMLKVYGSRFFTTLFVDGNHENHDALDSYPVEMWNGGKIHRISDSVIHLMRGQVYELFGSTFFTMGGAESSDKEYRKEGVSWWAREMPSDEEYSEAVCNLKVHDNKVDYIITHCAPENIIYYKDPVFLRAPNRLTRFLSDLITRYGIEYKDWFFGHYHDDIDIGKMHCIYNRILEINRNEVIKDKTPENLPGAEENDA